MRRTKISLIWLLVSLLILAGLLGIIIRATTFHPAAQQSEAIICSENAPLVDSSQSLKALTYNVQYMAGKNYVFFYDLPDNTGPHERPSAEDITQSFNEVARVIIDEDPDIIFLQELDDGAKRTDYEDQLARLMQQLPTDYVCQTEAFYWQASFVPHPRIMGAIGHKLAIISKYQINQATRYQLPLAPADPITQQFSPKRAMQEARLPTTSGSEIAMLNVHLEVANRGAEVKQQEMAVIQSRLEVLNQNNVHWLMGGDFNLLLPGQYDNLLPDHQSGFRPRTELLVLLDNYQVVPSLANVQNDAVHHWYTMNVNDPRVSAPDRTVDYFFFSDQIMLLDAYVRQHDALAISDHLPVVAEFDLSLIE